MTLARNYRLHETQHILRFFMNLVFLSRVINTFFKKRPGLEFLLSREGIDMLKFHIGNTHHVSVWSNIFMLQCYIS